MKSNNQTFRKILLFTLLLVIVIPFLQSTLNFVKVNPLKGAVVLAQSDTFSIEKWFTGDYQEKQTKYLNDNFGFRNIFVRLNNQIAYNLFKLAKANGVIIGKENYLYEEHYIKSYLGDDYFGKDSIYKVVDELVLIQDTLTKLNKTFFIVLAANKGSFYPEYFPEHYGKKNKINNYESYIKQFKNRNINYIDFDDYFISIKDKVKYPLFQKYGTHWSYYGGCLVIDSITKYIEAKRGIKIPHIYWNNVNEDFPKIADNDLADGMNLLFDFKDVKTAYPTIQYREDSGVIKPNILVIADSFYWILFQNEFSKAFTKEHFWFYNKEIYPENYFKPLTTDMVDLKEEINNHDIIVILAAPPNLTRLGWGFIQNAYSLFSQSEYDYEIKEIISDIYKNKEWFDQIRLKALNNNIPLDSMIYYDAVWVYNDMHKK